MFFSKCGHSIILLPAALAQVAHAHLHVQERDEHLFNDSRIVEAMMQLDEKLDVVSDQRLLDFIDIGEPPEQVHHILTGERGHSR